jgi:hypothetical protein
MWRSIALLHLLGPVGPTDCLRLAMLPNIYIIHIRVCDIKAIQGLSMAFVRCRPMPLDHNIIQMLVGSNDAPGASPPTKTRLAVVGGSLEAMTACPGQ